MRTILTVTCAVILLGAGYAAAANFGDGRSNGGNFLNQDGSSANDGANPVVLVSGSSSFTVDDGVYKVYEVYSGNELRIDGTLTVTGAGASVGTRNGGTITNNGTLAITNSGDVTNNGSLINNGAITVDGSLQSVGTLVNNASKTIQVTNGTLTVFGMQNMGTVTVSANTHVQVFGNIDNAVGTINATADNTRPFINYLVGNAGTVNVSGQLNNQIWNNASLTGGVINITEAQTTAGPASISVGQADVDFQAGGTVGAAVTAKNIYASANTDFSGALNGTLVARNTATATLLAASSLSGGIDVNGGSTLVNQSSTVVSATTVNNDGTIQNEGNLQIGAYAGAGAITQAMATANIGLDTGASGFEDAFQAITLTDGTVTVAGNGGPATAIALGAGTSGGTVNINTGGTWANNIDARAANLAINRQTTFNGTLAANNIDVNAASTFTITVTAGGALAVNADAKFGANITATGAFSLNNGAGFTADNAVTITAASHNVNGTLNATTSNTITFAGAAPSVIFGDSGRINLGPGDATGQVNFGDKDIQNATRRISVALNGDWKTGDVIFEGVANAALRDKFNFGRATVRWINDEIELVGYGQVSHLVGRDVRPDDRNINKIHGMTDLVDRITQPYDNDPNLPRPPIIDGIDNVALEILHLLDHPETYRDGVVAVGQALGEYGNAAREAMRNTTDQFWRRVYRRMDYNLDFNYGYSDLAARPIASDNGYASLGRSSAANGVWADFHGGWAKQKAKHRINGYDYDGYGVTVGYERRCDRLLFGVAAAYTRAGVDVDDLKTDYDADIFNLGLYAAYHHESGLFARAGLGFAYGWNDYDVDMVLNPNKSGSYDNQAYTANMDLGYALTTSFANFIPSVGVRYTHLRQDGWRESGGELGDRGFFEKHTENAVDVPLALRVNRVFDLGNVRLAPEVRGAFIYAAKKNRSKIDYGLRGASPTYTVLGVNPGRDRYQVGGGLKAKWCEKYEASLEYDYEWRSKFENHNVSLYLGMAF